MVMRYQPQGLLRIDQSHPLAAGLRLAMLPGVNRAFDVAGLRYALPTGLKQVGGSIGMAAGFGSTLGAGTSDKIVTGLSGAFPANGRSYFFKARRNGAGGGGLGRLFDKTNGSTGQMLYWSATSNALVISFYAGGAEQTAPISGSSTACAAGVDFDVLVTHSQVGSSSSFKAYLNGVLVTNSGLTATFNDAATTPLTIGNRHADNARGWDGLIECAYVWDRILSDAEAASLSASRYQFFASPYDDDDVIVIQAQTGISGALSNAFDSVSLAASGQLANLGPFASSLSGMTLSSSGLVGSAVSGALSPTMSDVILSASGLQTNFGTLSAPLAGITMAAQGVPAQNASGALMPPLADMTMNASGFQGAEAPRSLTTYRRRAPHRLVN